MYFYDRTFRENLNLLTVVLMISSFSCNKDGIQSTSGQDDGYVFLDTVSCNNSSFIDDWVLDDYNSYYTIMYPSKYEREPRPDLNDHIFRISKDSFKTYISGGFCHGTIFPCHSVDYAGVAVFPPGDTIVGKGIMYPIHNKYVYMVCERNNPSVLFAYEVTNIEVDTTNFGTIYLVNTSMDSIYWGGSSKFYSSDKEEVLQILQTLKRK